MIARFLKDSQFVTWKWNAESMFKPRIWQAQRPGIMVWYVLPKDLPGMFWSQWESTLGSRLRLDLRLFCSYCYQFLLLASMDGSMLSKQNLSKRPWQSFENFQAIPCNWQTWFKRFGKGSVCSERCLRVISQSISGRQAAVDYHEYLALDQGRRSTCWDCCACVSSGSQF